MISENFSEAVISGLAGGAIGLALIFIIVLLVLLICLLIGRIMLFRKCGQAGWKAIIPFYSDYVMDCKVCGIHWAFFVAEVFLTFGGYTWLVTAFIRAMRYYNLAIKCHKDAVPSTIFGALFPSIVEMVYGFGSSYQYDASEPVGNCGFFNKVVK